MATGISSPLRLAQGGRFHLTSGGLHLSELLSAALQDGESDNPFQEPGLGEFMIFQIATESLFSEVATKIREIFEDFEENELARLQDNPENLQTVQGSESGSWEILVLYIDLETDTPGTLKVVGGSAQGVAVEVVQ